MASNKLKVCLFFFFFFFWHVSIVKFHTNVKHPTAKVPSKGARGKAKGKKARAKGEDEYEDEDGQHNTQNVALDSLLPDTEVDTLL